LCRAFGVARAPNTRLGTVLGRKIGNVERLGDDDYVTWLARRDDSTGEFSGARTDVGDARDSKAPLGDFEVL
jgi:hypothetical protein